MATAEEMDVLNWFLGNNDDLFPGVTAIAGTVQEDWAGIDAWLMRDGKRRVSVGIRRHADEVTDRYFTLRVQQGAIDSDRFEFAKLVASGGPQFYLQAWGHLPNNLKEFVFISVERMRDFGCFKPEAKDAFWEEDYYTMSKTRWAAMTVEKLHDIGNCVVISDVYSRGTFGSELLDNDILKSERKHFRVHPGETPE